jgi:hypothetical protein
MKNMKIMRTIERELSYEYLKEYIGLKHPQATL